MPRQPNNASDPWSFNPFETLTGHEFVPGATPTQHPKVPKPLPESDTLFSIQKDLVKVVNMLAMGEHEHVERMVQQAYRRLQKYLTTWG